MNSEQCSSFDLHYILYSLHTGVAAAYVVKSANIFLNGIKNYKHLNVEISF